MPSMPRPKNAQKIMDTILGTPSSMLKVNMITDKKMRKNTLTSFAPVNQVTKR